MKNILMTLIVLLASTICSCDVGALKVAIKEHNAQAVRKILAELDHLSRYDKRIAQDLAKESFEEALNELSGEQFDKLAPALLPIAILLPVTFIALWFRPQSLCCGTYIMVILALSLSISRLYETAMGFSTPEHLKVHAAEAIVQMIKGAKIA